MNIAITGSTGFIGRNFIKSHHANYTLLVRKKSINSYSGTNFREFKWDFSTLDFGDTLKDVDVLVHLACSLNARSSDELVKEYYEINLRGSANLFDQYKKHNPNGKIIFLSSGGAVYDSSTNTEKFENEVRQPSSAYGYLKMEIEAYLTEVVQISNLRAISLRVSNPYGELLSSQRQQGFIGIALKNALDGVTLNIFENKNTVRDYLHLDDLNDILKTIIYENVIPNGEHRVYNIGSGIGSSLEEITFAIEKVTGKKLNVNYSNQEREPTYNILNIEKIRKDFQWQPKIGLTEGLRRCLINEGRTAL